MPGATSDDRWPRVVIDEASFDFRALSDADVERCLDQFNVALTDLRDDSQMPAVYSDYNAVECRDGVELVQFIFGRETGVDPDIRRRTGVLLDRCREWDDKAPAGCEPLDLPETPIPAFSAGFALAMGLSGRAVGCLVVSTCQRRGPLTLTNGSGSTAVVFFAAAPEVRWVWRRAFTLEDVPEREFFSVAAFAFPALVFHPNLSFGKFVGSYPAVRDPVVRILCALNDHFPRVLSEYQGLPHAVAAAMGQYGVDLSPESPNTRASEAFMRKRYVTYNESRYCCEWHAKIERHRNRIHFTLPAAGPAGHILIGIFTEHLDV
ncbi:MAG: hypothetical protein ACRDSR_24405 [Pseudonocardiaceae bacterium]